MVRREKKNSNQTTNTTTLTMVNSLVFKSSISQSPPIPPSSSCSIRLLHRTIRISSYLAAGEGFEVCEMGLATLPSPSEGMFILLLVNTASSLALVKELLRVILRVLGSYLVSSDPWSGHIAITPAGKTYAQQLVEDFRSWSPTIYFEKLRCGDCLGVQQECTVCLNHFEPESEVNKLGCGHVFHNVCLEKWLNYSNTTCPLCRTPMMPQDESSLVDCFFN